ncbi:dephospho-CoA kinase [Sinomonas sp. ASV322]|uniref:dephospho-CoA kinase n=1 Tax=Sinomonas sp. ASV322 TaxID=3041920 RepID=UPI0027DCE428|nr:dephospho-CoA kinase [Sinomonas sp. ASV322]MDQ4500944.1 dephospho-CoA kinase [Sinomonas sp. ASV322]
MLRVGLTGGIGAGKSEVARRLAELGAVLVDADAIAREVVEPGTAGLADVAEAFGPEVMTDDGELDRAALGAIVFADPRRRELLNSIVHPLVRARAAELVAAAPQDAVVVEDIPLLVETGQAARFDVVVVVEAPDELRVRRLADRRGMGEDQARARMAAQASGEERRAAADHVIENRGSLSELRAAVDRLWRDVLEPAATSEGRGAERG